jgi:hypothetical protein
MRKMLRSAVLALAVAGLGLPVLTHAADAPPPAAKKDGQADVPVKVVVLFSSGVGYFEAASATSSTSDRCRGTHRRNCASRRSRSTTS